MKRILVILILVNFVYMSKAVLLPSIYSDHMVLQKNQKVRIWGWGNPKENISIIPSWDNSETKTVANNHAFWEAYITTPGTAGSYSIKVKGYNEIVINDVLLGEVWLCSGQSNMDMTTKAGIINGEQEIKLANHPQIRFFKVARRTALNPQLDVVGNWVVCTPETMPDFSAIAYFFGKRINEKLNVAVGLINSSWGGTPAEIWYDSKYITSDSFLLEGSKNLPEREWGPREPGAAYNAMISPLVLFNIAGVLWYQGESNVSLDKYYPATFSALIKSWRKAWGYDFPFYYVQIAPYHYGVPFEGVKIQNAQRLVKEPNSGMVVINDIGDTADIHPKNKIEVGYRLANLALGKHYDIAGVPVSGPLYKEMKIEKNKIRILFDYAEKGLKSPDKTLRYFEIAGNDNVFYPATAKIDGNTVLVSSDKVKEPVFVRFAWSNVAIPALFNAEGLPASCFTTAKVD